jgi:hypothetical protein
MPLVTLKTNLKSLKYGHDRIYGASSKQPYIVDAIPEKETNPNFTAYNNDYILRGGVFAARDSATDVLRLSKMFVDTTSPSGIFFTTKQQLLSRLSVRTQTSGLLNQGIYTPLNTLTEAGLVAFGGHVLKNGLGNSVNPFAGTGAYSTNENLYGVRITNQRINETDSELNRLLLIYNGLMLQQPITSPIPDGFTYNNGVNILSYSGGPGSILGVGKTNIRYGSNTTFSPSVGVAEKPNIRKFSNDTLVNSALDNTDDSKINFGRSTYVYTPTAFDFRAKLRRGLTKSTVMSDAPSYVLGDGKTIENRVNLGNPGNRTGKNLISYTRGSGIGPVDQINAMAIYQSENVSHEHIVNDLVKFRIAAIDNTNPTQKTFIHFRAFLDNFSDNYNATWNPFTYLGRGENFYTYSNFTRTINLGWTVAAQSKEELIPMYKKLNYLASLITPDYTSKGYMAGNLVQLTIGGYLYEQVGFITSLTYDIPAESPWEIGINDRATATDESVKELSHMIKVTGFQFTPIHDFVPSKQSISAFNSKGEANLGNYNQEATLLDGNTYGPQRYIALANGTRETDSNYYKDPSIAGSVRNTPPPSILPKALTVPVGGPQRENVSRLGGATPTISNPINLPNNFTGI